MMDIADGQYHNFLKGYPFCMTGNHLNCHFPRKSNYQDRLISQLVHHLGCCIQTKCLENQTLHNLSPSLRRISKPSQKIRCQRFFKAIALHPVQSRLLLPTVRGCLLLTVTSDRRLVGGVAGS